MVSFSSLEFNDAAKRSILTQQLNQITNLTGLFQALEAGQRQLARQRRALHLGQDPVPGPEVVATVRKIHFRFRVDRPQVREAAERRPLQSHQDRKSADVGHLVGGQSSRRRLPQPDVALGEDNFETKLLKSG